MSLDKTPGVALSDLAKAISSDQLLMRLAQAAGGLPGGERLAAGLTSPHGPRPPTSLLVKELREQSAREAYVWQGWGDSPLPAMARLALRRAANKPPRQPRFYLTEPPREAWQALTWAAARAIERSDAGSHGMGLAAVRAIASRWDDARSDGVGSVLVALAQKGNRVGFERLCAMMPEKKAPDAKWSAEELKTALREARDVNRPARKFWGFSSSGTEEGRLAGFCATLSRTGQWEGKKLRSSAVASALASWPDHPELAMGLLKKGWRSGAGDEAWAAVTLNDSDWREFKRLEKIQWLETHRSAKEGRWTSDESAVALAAALIALERDDAPGLARAASRFPELKEEVSAPKGKCRWGPWSLMGLAAALGAGDCLTALAPAAQKQNSVRATLTRLNAYPDDIAGSTGARLIYAWSQDGADEGLAAIGRGADDSGGFPKPRGVEESWRLNLTEAALLSGSPKALEAVSLIERGFAARLSSAMDRFGAMATEEQRLTADRLMTPAPSVKRRLGR